MLRKLLTSLGLTGSAAHGASEHHYNAAAEHALLKRLIAAISAIVLTLGVTTLVGTAASAHTGDLNATAVCQDDGTYLVTYKLTISQTGLSGSTKWRVGTTTFEGTPTSNSGLNLGPVASSGAGVITLGTKTVPGTSTKAPWAYAYTTWSDGYKLGSDGGDISLNGNCKTAQPGPKSGDQTRTTQVCNTPKDGTATLTTYTKSWTQAYVWNSKKKEWELGDKVYGKEVVSSTEKVNDSKCAPPVVDKCTNLAGNQANVPAGWDVKGTTCSHTEIVCWLMDNYNGGSKEPAAGDAGRFPQSRVDCGTTIPCGKWVQQDRYLIDSDAKEDAWQGLGNTLTESNGEASDHLIYKASEFIYGGKCKPEQPQPVTGKDTRHVQECTVPANGTATITYYDTSWTRNYTWDANSWKWVLGAKVYGDETVSKTETVTDSTCAPPVIDKCTNLAGVQANVPEGWVADGKTCSHTETVCWLMDHYTGGATQPAAGDASGFPQTRVDCGTTIPCGQWVQKDVYFIDSDAKEAVWQGLGDTLTYGNGHVEDQLIYQSHHFIYGGKCTPPPVDICKWVDGHAVQTTIPAADLKDSDILWNNGAECAPSLVCVYSQGDDSGHEVSVPAGTNAPTGSVPWKDGSECTPALDIDLSTITPVCSSGVPYLDIHVNLNDPGQRAHVTYDNDGNATIDLLFFDGDGHSQAMDNVPLDSSMNAHILWPGASVDGDGNGNGWPGWELQDGTWVNVGDGNFGWTRSDASLTIHFNPTTTLALAYPEENFDCVTPPPTEVCVYTQGDTTGHMVEVPAGEAAPAGSTAWTGNGDSCTPDVCSNITGPQIGVPTGLQLLYSKTAKAIICAHAPTLGGSLFSSQCVDDVPWINYDIKLTDDDGVSTDDGTATFTFTAEDSTETYVKVVPVGSGRFLWPGASATPDGDGTFTATGWPGWDIDSKGNWVSVGDENYGWTRDGVNVHIEVNPEMDVTLEYPPPLPTCVAGPPTEIHAEMDAPPADAVEAEAQYAG